MLSTSRSTERENGQQSSVAGQQVVTPESIHLIPRGSKELLDKVSTFLFSH